MTFLLPFKTIFWNFFRQCLHDPHKFEEKASKPPTPLHKNPITYLFPHKNKNTENTGCLKKNGAVFILQISQQPSIGFSNCFFLLKTEIHM